MKKLLFILACLSFATPAFCENVTVIKDNGRIETYQVFQTGRTVEVFRHGTDGSGITKTTILRDVNAPGYREDAPAASFIPLADD